MLEGAGRTARRAQDDACARGAVAAAPSDAGEEPTKVLVVDDEPDVETLFRLRFRADVKAGRITILFAENGARALERLRDDPDIAVVVTDLNMPEMDGLTLLREILALDRRLRTIVITAYSDMSNIRTAMRRGAFDFQVKPLDIDDLRATLAKAVEVVRELRAGDAARAAADALRARNEDLRLTFGRYVSDAVVEYLLERADAAKLQGTRRDLTVMMADVRGFSVLSEQLEPEKVVEALNSYLTRAIEVILRWQGTVNEILGDGLLVFFGAPMQDPDAPEHAVAAALELQLAMDELNASHRDRGLPEFTIGIGINTGDAIVGTIGSPQRMKYAAVGRTVNVAARIESHTVGGQILISEATRARLGDLAEVSLSFEGRAKGVHGPLAMHEVIGLGGSYGLHFERATTALRSLAEPVDVEVSPVTEKLIGDPIPASIVAVGPEKLRVVADRRLGPLDDLVIRFEGGEIYGKVLECQAEGRRHALTLALTSVTGGVRAALEALHA